MNPSFLLLGALGGGKEGNPCHPHWTLEWNSGTLISAWTMGTGGQVDGMNTGAPIPTVPRNSISDAFKDWDREIVVQFHTDYLDNGI